MPLLMTSHQHHATILAWARDVALSLSGHALAETYAVLTRLPGDARVAAADATRMLDENFEGPLLLSMQGMRNAPHVFASAGVAGGATYDGLVGLAAREHGAVLVTRDARALSTYKALGATVELLTTAESNQ